MFQLNQVLLYISIDRKMVMVTCLSPTKSYSYCSSLLFSFCSLAILDLQSLNGDPSTRGDQRATIQNNQKDTSKNNTPKQKKI